MKAYIRSMIAGALVIGTATSYLAPKFIAWWFEPPVPLGFSCKVPIEYALARLQLAQLIGLIIGAGVGLVTYMGFARKKAKRLSTPGTHT